MKHQTTLTALLISALLLASCEKKSAPQAQPSAQADTILQKLVAFGFNENTSVTVVGEIDATYLIVHTNYSFQAASIAHASNKLVVFENGNIAGFYYGIDLLPKIEGNALIFPCEASYGNIADFSDGIPQTIWVDGETHTFATETAQPPAQADTPAPSSFAGYKAVEVQKSAYPKYNTECPWESVVAENAALRLYYKTAEEQGIEFITELHYVLESGGEKTALGGFSVEKGFFDALGNPPNHARSNHLKGLCLEKTLANPFFVYSVYEDKDSGELYETEVFCMLAFGGKNKTLVNWNPWEAEDDTPASAQPQTEETK